MQLGKRGLVWDDEAGTRLVLPVPFGCSLEDLPAGAETALRALSAETRALPRCILQLEAQYPV